MLAALGLLPVLATAARAADSDFTMLVEPVFEGLEFSIKGVPLRISVGNKGQDARGSVVVNARGARMTYPIQLPQGSSKSFIAYVTGGGYESPTITLDTDRGRVSQQFKPNMGGMTTNVALITDAPGLMSFLRKSDSNSGQTIIDVYGTPGLLPERAVGFDSISAVLLGEGAERISKVEVDALKDYVMRGGVLLFIGGAAAPTLTDPRWGELIPVKNPSTTVIPGKSFGKIFKTPPTDNVSVSVVQPKAGAKVESSSGGTPLIVSRTFGAGATVFWAFNPFERPISSWEGRAAVIRSVAARDRSSLVRQMAGLSTQDEYGYSGGYGYGSPTMVPPMPMGADMSSDPFSTKLPPASTVVWVMVGYFIVVVPLNLLILRKLGKGEWAWGTTPVISLVFAGIYFSFAGGLYSAELSTATSGALIVDSREPEAIFLGKSQLFFPRGGSYDLKLQGIENMEVPGMNYYRNPGTSDTASAMNPIDVGEIVVPRMRVSNLSFHQFEYEQHLQLPKWVTSHIALKKENNTIGGYITNTSDETWYGARLYAGNLIVELGEVLPGKQVALGKLPARVSTSDDRPNYNSSSITSASRLSRTSAVLTTHIRGIRLGPMLGREVPNYKSINLIANMPLEAGQ